MLVLGMCHSGLHLSIIANISTKGTKVLDLIYKTFFIYPRRAVQGEQSNHQNTIFSEINSRQLLHLVYLIC